MQNPKIQYIRLQSGDPIPTLNDISYYVAIVIIEDTVDTEWRDTASKWLVGSGCLYMMAWGLDCSSWDDSVDFANLEAFGFSNIPDDHLVMTSWYENEPLRDVFYFAKFIARHPTVKLENTLILHISPSDRQCEFKVLYKSLSSI